MDTQPSVMDVIAELESRHDELLARLEELDQRVAQTLKEWTEGLQSRKTESAA